MQTINLPKIYVNLDFPGINKKQWTYAVASFDENKFTASEKMYQTGMK